MGIYRPPVDFPHKGPVSMLLAWTTVNKQSVIWDIKRFMLWYYNWYQPFEDSGENTEDMA